MNPFEQHHNDAVVRSWKQLTSFNRVFVNLDHLVLTHKHIDAIVPALAVIW